MTIHKIYALTDEEANKLDGLRRAFLSAQVCYREFERVLVAENKPLPPEYGSYEGMKNEIKDGHIVYYR